MHSSSVSAAAVPSLGPLLGQASKQEQPATGVVFSVVCSHLDRSHIDYLIAKVDSGEYDPELLSDIEQDQVAERLNQTNNNA